MDAVKIRQIFLLLLGLTYIGIGIFIYFRQIIASPLGEILALAFVAYGSWRAYRALTKR